MIVSRRLVVALVATAGLLTPASMAAQSPAAPSASASAAGAYQPGTVSIVLEPFVEGLESPVFLTPDGSGDGRLYVVEQGGTIQSIDPDGAVGEVPFLDITDRVEAGGEQGLLGLAFHPDYAANGRLFVYYTAANGNSQVVSEFTAAAGSADAASERVLLDMPDFAGNHNGGMLAFDATGLLLIGTGDGGGGGDPEGNGQDNGQLLGKLLRIDIDGAAPYAVPDNDPDGLLGADARPETLATGLRNPWRFSVDRSTGDVFIADVGQGEWEEVNVLPAGRTGANFGWSVMEGPDCFERGDCDADGLTLPVAVYGHGDGGCTVIGGYVYRGSVYPSLSGAYLYGDYCSGDLSLLPAADAVATGAAASEVVGNAGGNISAFGQGDDGELYAVYLGGLIARVTAVDR